MKNIGVILSGCGVYDGSEIHEAACVLLALAQQGVQVHCFAPDIAQRDVVNHLNGQPQANPRNVLEESARIARGAIKPLWQADALSLDALIVPGGFGAAKNLCDFALKGAQCEVIPELRALLERMRELGKPLCFVCIAPVIAAKVFGAQGVSLTTGSSNDDTAQALAAMGATPIECAADDCHVDAALKIISTPAYMRARGIDEVFAGVHKAVQALIKLI